MGIHIAGKLMAEDRAHVLDDHAHKESLVYPTLADGVIVTGAAGAWTLGAFAEIVPINTITDDFDIHFISVEDLSANDIYEIHIFEATTLIGVTRVVKTANQDSTTQVPIQTPIVRANSQIQAKIASASGGSDTATISIFYHEY